MTIAPTKQILMSDMFSDNERVGARRFKVATATRQELQIARGEYFVGSSQRVGIPVNNTFYSVIKAASDKYLVIEDALPDLNYQDLSNGSYNVELDGFVDISNGNTWTHNTISPLPIGRPLSASLINSFPSSTVDLGVAVTLTGDADYRLYFSNFYRETKGSSESVSGSGSSFFESGRQIVLSPNQEILIRTRTSGEANGVADLNLIFFTSEIAQEDAPSLLGI